MAASPASSDGSPAASSDGARPLPPYSQMIVEAIAALGEPGGSTQSAVARRIEAAYGGVGGLPLSHAAVVAAHLGHLAGAGDLITVAGGRYMLPYPAAGAAQAGSDSSYPSELGVYCKAVFSGNSKLGTSHLHNHYKSHHKQTSNQGILSLNKEGYLAAWSYNEEVSIRKYYLAMIMHEYPFNYCEHEYTNDFIKSICPQFPIRCRNTAKKHVMEIFVIERQKLKGYLSTLNGRFSCTMDLWTSNQNKGYMCVTCHFIDDSWQIQKRIINFMHVEGKHSGQNLSIEFVKNMIEWNIEHKLFALTLDNAAANEVCVHGIISTLDEHGCLICNGKFFHVRCAAHIINLIARDGLKVVGTAIDHIHYTVKIIKKSPQQLEEFIKQASDLGLDTTKGLSLDVATRWNSTYLMLETAIYYKKVFQRLAFLYPEKYGQHAPSKEEWDKASVMCQCLKIFYDATKLLSGSLYPTANLFFVEFCEIKIQLNEWINSNDELVRIMAKAMKEKFDKYWELSNLALGVACFLDPRYKMKVIEFFCDEICKVGDMTDIYEFKSVIKELFLSYESQYVDSTIGAIQSIIQASNNSVQRYTNVAEQSKRRKLDAFLNENCEDDVQKSELDNYMDEPRLKWPDGECFDILAWWKTQGIKYPILSRMARDVLAIPVSTVASESAFSAGGRVVDKYRSRLDPKTVEALICTKDWMRACGKGSDILTIIDEFKDQVEDHLQ